MIQRLLDFVATRLRVASLVVAAAMIGAGGAAAVTVTNVADSTPSQVVTAEDTPTSDETTEPEETTEGDDTSAEDGTSTSDETEGTESDEDAESGEDGDDPATEEGETEPPLDPEACAAAGNHGEYVSHIAKMTQGLADHGQLVSAAAHSDCGKAEATEGDDAEDTSDEDSTGEMSEAKVTREATATTHGNGHGKGHTKVKHGKGHGKHKR